MSWVFPESRFLLRPVPSDRKRVLAIWDFRSQPYSIGDLLLLQESALILCHQHGVDKIDVCLLAEPDEPSRPSFKDLNVNSSNYMGFIVSLLPVLLAESHIGELHLFDSHAALENYIGNNAHRYYIWPTADIYLNRKDLGFLALLFLAEFYEKHGYVPPLTFRPALVDKASSFIAQHVSPAVPFVVQLRNVDTYNTFRNSVIESWLELFRYCENRFPVRFIVICSKAEVDDRLRHFGNVIIAKDFDTTVDLDLALIQSAAAYMGMSSGPSTVAFLGNKPYSMLNTWVEPGWFDKVVIKQPWGFSFIFSHEHQRCIAGHETPEVLIDEFSRLFSAIDISAWQSFASQAASVDLGEAPLRLR
ncbi:MAG TPA: hypothetical protein VF544_00405 [Pyrinomonadaceae bacterium]|jgi:hypothetical protein